MALTATANKRTRADIVSQLKLQPDHAYFFQSFNRTNLRYIVRRKKGNIVNEIATMLNAEYRGKSGIIYCHSRKSCESVAQSLRDKGLTASHFHALMSPAEKEQAAQDWQAGRVPVLAATVCSFYTLLPILSPKVEIRLHLEWASINQTVRHSFHPFF